MKKIIKLLKQYEKIKGVFLYLELYTDYSGIIVNADNKKEVFFEFSSKNDLTYQLLDVLRVEYSKGGE